MHDFHYAASRAQEATIDSSLEDKGWSKIECLSRVTCYVTFYICIFEDITGMATLLQCMNARTAHVYGLYKPLMKILHVQI